MGHYVKVLCYKALKGFDSLIASAKIGHMSELPKHFNGNFNINEHFNFYLEPMFCRFISSAFTEMFISQIHTHKEAAKSSSPIPKI